MPRRGRLDAELVRRGLARSREHAACLVEDGRVSVRGLPASKAATGVDADTPVTVAEATAGPDWASRGAYKLVGALERFAPAGLRVAGRRCLDAGASTGGFTDVLLHEGALQVVAVDVGYGQIAWRLRTDPRVTVHDRTNVRHLDPATLRGPVELTVADLSFISLRLVLPALLACTVAGGDLVPMVKPQFEIGRERLGSGGVVRDPALREAAVLDVVSVAQQHGAALQGVTASPLPGPAGNVEYFLWLRLGRAAPQPGADELVRAAVREGPQ
ncbi:MAG: TlyA family rRNA (cytidine-2'-O)-methyltransferase [Pseudonocardiaceae bacterium]|nr:TlyA family rRNA (cytidine-2'-O)-methyltransferase [Pseudonocardiaceae bacterium]